MLDPAHGLADCSPPAKDAVEGEKKGPVISEQPEAQPVAAGPVKVTVNFPKLEDETVLGVDFEAPVPACAGRANSAVTASVTANDNNAYLDGRNMRSSWVILKPKDMNWALERSAVNRMAYVDRFGF